MKILHVIGYIQPEMGYEEHYSAKWQAIIGHNVHVVTSDRIYPFKGIQKEDRIRGTGVFFESGYKIHRLKTIFEISFSEILFVRGIKNKIQEIKPDIIHIHGGRCPVQFYASYLAKKMGIKSVADHHQFEYDIYDYLKRDQKIKYAILSFLRNLQEYSIRKLMNLYVYNNAKYVIPVRKMSEQHLLKKLKINKNKIYFNPLGVDTEIFKFSQEHRILIRSRMGILKNEILLIHVAGSFDPYKKLDKIIKILEDKQLKNIKILVIGSEKYLTYFNNSKYFKRRLFFISMVSYKKLFEYYSASDIAVWFSNYSVSLLEAIACELPIICPDFLKEDGLIEGNGFFIKKDDIKDLIKQIKIYSLLSKEKIEIMRKKSREIILSKFSYKIFANNLIKLYKSE